MQIQKINKNQLEIILNLEDLKENNISLHSFMCNSDESQKLFLNILNFADKEVGFSLKNYEIVIEAFSIPIKTSFVLLITRIPTTNSLHILKTKYGIYKLSKSIFLKFDEFDEFCMFCNTLNYQKEIKSTLYLLNGHYFLSINVRSLKALNRLLLTAQEFSDYIYKDDYLIDENADILIKDFAIQTCKKYFV